jgi:hypothetical protein
MKNPAASVCSILLLLFSTAVEAQSLLDLGQIKLSIQPLSPSSQSDFRGEDYVFSADNGSSITFTNNGGEYTDVTCSGDFTAGAKTINLICKFRITPSGAGTFIIRTGDNDPPKNSDIRITVDNGEVPMHNMTRGAEGKLVVTNYPTDTGGFLVGTFTVTLGDSPNPDLVKDLYKVTGSIKVKKF